MKHLITRNGKQFNRATFFQPAHAGFTFQYL